MTWGEWVDSTYNTEGYRVEYDRIYFPVGRALVTKGSQSVSTSDIILANTVYSVIGEGALD